MPLSAPLPITWSIAVQTKPSQQTTTIVNLNPNQVAQTLPLNLGLADPSFCDVQQRGFIRASELFQSMKSGFVANKSRRTCEKIPILRRRFRAASSRTLKNMGI
jgi:hypothetical protein